MNSESFDMFAAENIENLTAKNEALEKENINLRTRVKELSKALEYYKSPRLITWNTGEIQESHEGICKKTGRVIRDDKKRKPLGYSAKKALKKWGYGNG